MIVALLNQNGGVGKTTLALHLAGAWGAQGKRVILIIADPQGSALDWSQQRGHEGLLRLFTVIARETAETLADNDPPLPATRRRSAVTDKTGRAAHEHPQADGPAPFTTLVELTFQKKKVERWIRFGRKSFEQIIDRRRSLIGFAPESIFAFVRWASNDYGTIVSRIDILRAAGRGEPYQTVPFVRPGGEILLRLDGWRQVHRVLAQIDAMDTLGVDPTDVTPDHWRHVHNRLSAGQEPNPYTPERHAAWVSRRRIAP